MCAELRELVKMHAVHQESNEEPLSYDEVLVVKVMVIMSLWWMVRSKFKVMYAIFRVRWR